MRSNQVNSSPNNLLPTKTLLLSSHQISWNGILVEQYQSGLTPSETDVPAQSDHLLKLHLGQPVRLIQKRDDRVYESTVYQGESMFVPAEQPSYWRCNGSDTPGSALHIHLQPKAIAQIAETVNLNQHQLELVSCFAKSDLHLYQVAMLLLAELQAGGIMGQLYVESLTQVLVIHLLRYYSASTQKIQFEHKTLTNRHLQQTIDYIHAHLDRDLSLVQIAQNSHISPTYFARLFKTATGISLHQYVIRQRVERAKFLLKTTDLPIASIAIQVGFSSQSHLTRHCKQLMGMTPRELSKTARI